MTAETLPDRWNVDERHFRWRNAHVKPSIGYKLWFYNLRLSRDYYLAHKQASNRLSYAEEWDLPNDFDSVRRTYALAGNVWDGLFESWWVERGRDLFATAGPEVRVDLLFQLPSYAAVDQSQLSAAINQYQAGVIRELNHPETLIVGVPLTGHKTELLEAFGRLLDDFQNTQRPESTLRLNNKVNQPNAMKNYLDLLWVKTNEPWLDLWEVCMRIGLSGEARALKAKGETPDKSLQTQMASITSTMYAKARLIAESAARGSFPTPLGLELCRESDDAMAERCRLIWECHEIENSQLHDSHFKSHIKSYG
jgi:hypothetical protein